MMKPGLYHSFSNSATSMPPDPIRSSCGGPGGGSFKKSPLVVVVTLLFIIFKGCENSFLKVQQVAGGGVVSGFVIF